MNNTETERSQEVRGHDKACEKFHLGPPVAVQSYHALETRSTDQEKAGAGAAAALGAVLLSPHKAPLFPRRSMRRSTSEPAAREMTTRDRLYRWPAGMLPASGTGHLTRSRPQDSASNAAPQWELRKPLGGTRKPRRVVS